MKKFNVGDEITIREDLSIGMGYMGCMSYSESEIGSLRGKKAKIVDIYGNGYKLDVDNEGYYWAAGLFLEYQTEIYNILEKHEKWVRNEKGGERADLRNADLRYVDFRNADLRNVNFNNANFRNADLSNADLSNANLSHADFRNADLRNADLRNADLRYVDFRNADLRNVNFNNANFRNADLSNADLSNANLSHANLSHANFSNAKLICNEITYKLSKCITVNNIGSRNDTTCIFITECNNVIVRCGCFFNLLDEFEKVVRQTHKGNKFEQQYNAVIALAKTFVNPIEE